MLNLRVFQNLYRHTSAIVEASENRLLANSGLASKNNSAFC